MRGKKSNHVCGLEAWGQIMETNSTEADKIQRNALQQILHFPKSTLNTGILTQKCSVKISIMNTDDERIAKKIIKEQKNQDNKKKKNRISNQAGKEQRNNGLIKNKKRLYKRQ